MSNSSSWYEVLIEVSGAADVIEAFIQQHLRRRSFTFETLLPIPSEIPKSVDSILSDGYDAQFGDWTAVANRHMFIEAAAERGFPFPLQSREQVLACLGALGEHGAEALRRGQAFKASLDRYGVGEVSAWCKLNWGVDTDANDTIACITPTSVSISLVLGSAPNVKLMRAFSDAHPDLHFALCFVTTMGKRPNGSAFYRGKKQTTPIEEFADTQSRIQDFRRVNGLAWLSCWVAKDIVEAALAMNESGRYFLRDISVSLDFAMSRLRAGESSESLRQRYPEIIDAHARLLDALHALDKTGKGRAH